MEGVALGEGRYCFPKGGYFTGVRLQLGPSKGRYCDPRIYELTDCKHALGFRV